MEPHHQNQQQQPNEDSSGGSGKGTFICRPSSTRWTPTPEQIRILKDLYYNNGVRSPTAEQIQKISARLRQYGKIEGKNVFYWFQNHKARERQKKRLTATTPTSVSDVPMQQQQKLAPNCGWKPEDYLLKPHLNTAPSSSSAGHGVYTPGQMGNFGSYGSVTMEKSFRDCSISNGGSGVGGSITHNFGWVGIDPYTSSSYTLFGNKIEELEEDEDEDENEDEDEEVSADIETLPLFPMHGEDNFNTFCNFKQDSNNYCSARYGSDDGHSGSRASLELSLNSYTSWSSGPM